MDLGIAGRKAIVCASSRGLGRACARALAEAGCDVTINGRDGKALEQTAAELRQATGAKAWPGPATACMVVWRAPVAQMVRAGRS